MFTAWVWFSGLTANICPRKSTDNLTDVSMHFLTSKSFFYDSFMHWTFVFEAVGWALDPCFTVSRSLLQACPIVAAACLWSTYRSSGTDGVLQAGHWPNHTASYTSADCHLSDYDADSAHLALVSAHCVHMPRMLQSSASMIDKCALSSRKSMLWAISLQRSSKAHLLTHFLCLSEHAFTQNNI